MNARLLCLVVAAACASPRAADNRTDSAVAAPTQAATSTATTAASGGRASDSTLVVYKTPTCGCCKAWVDHMRESGFAVEVHDLGDLTAVKNEAGVPDELRTCHTARIGGYVVEGHVPAADVKRLLAERPAVAGIGTPGMPVGSPGMEGVYRDRYDVLTFGGTEKPRVFASH